MTSSADKIAGAPISWGVCEVPGWGFQLPPDRVLTEMQQVGLAATEFGPDGFLPADPTVMAELLAARHLTAARRVHPGRPARARPRPSSPRIDRLLDSYDASHADVLVLSAATGQDGYDTRPELDESGWKTLLGNLDRLMALAARRGVRAVLHPHVGTMVERGADVQRVLEGSAISLCLDTGHLLIGGTDPAELTRQAPDCIAHTHFKDVNDQIAAQVRLGLAGPTPRPSGAACISRWAAVTWTSPPLSATCAGATTTAGTSWSKTPSSPRNPAAKARSRTSGTAPPTCASC